ncbi:MAG TPA: hypothetical protein VNZ53_04170 [Steroidobacteraceae bacterium]|jgi:hypothetical protein|nr:hypothetical protein [Steroidobacteraceae bacterium]
MIEFRDSTGMLRLPDDAELDGCDAQVKERFITYRTAFRAHAALASELRDAQEKLVAAKSARDAAQMVMLRLQPTGEAERDHHIRAAIKQWREDNVRS